MDGKKPTRLKRLPRPNYCGTAWVHWILAIDERRVGWLDAKLLYRFREVLTHTAFRYQLACPIFCLMPDHMHLLWVGLAETSNQLTAMQRFRLDMNDSLQRIGYSFQRQSYDHVFKGNELEQNAIEDVVDYIARNPERKQLVPLGGFATYPYTGCLLPGACRLRLFEEGSWREILRTLAFLRRTQCFRVPDPSRQLDDGEFGN